MFAHSSNLLINNKFPAAKFGWIAPVAKLDARLSQRSYSIFVSSNRAAHWLPKGLRLALELEAQRAFGVYSQHPFLQAPLAHAYKYHCNYPITLNLTSFCSTMATEISKRVVEETATLWVEVQGEIRSDLHRYMHVFIVAGCRASYPCATVSILFRRNWARASALAGCFIAETSRCIWPNSWKRLRWT